MLINGFSESHVGGTVQHGFFRPVYGAGEDKFILQSGLPDRGFDDRLMAAFVGSGDDHLPAGRLDDLPGLHQIQQAFLCVNSGKEQDFSRRSLGIGQIAPFGEVGAIGDDGDGLAQAKAAKIDRFLFRRGVQDRRRCQIPPLIKLPGQALFPGFVIHRPRFQHSVRGNHEGDIELASEAGHGVVELSPQAVIVQQRMWERLANGRAGRRRRWARDACRTLASGSR